MGSGWPAAEIRRAASAPVSEVRINAAKARSGRVGCRNRGAISGAITIRRSRPKLWASRLAKRADCGAGRVSNRVLARDCVAMPQVLPRSDPLWQRRTMTDLTFLGIESSCDDTAAAVVRAVGGRAEILASVVEGQTALHAAYGGAGAGGGGGGGWGGGWCGVWCWRGGWPARRVCP